MTKKIKSIIWINTSALLLALNFISPVYAQTLPTNATVQSTIQIDIEDEEIQCQSAVVRDNNGDIYYFWADDLSSIIGQMTPYKTLGNVLINPTEEYKQTIENGLIEAVDQYFAEFSLSERGNVVLPQRFEGYHTIYSTKNGKVLTNINEKGLIENVGVNYVKADTHKFSELGMTESSLILSPDGVFQSKEKAIKSMTDTKGFPVVNFYDAATYSFSNESNSIISLTGEDILELSSFRPKMIILDNCDTDIITEGIHPVCYIYDSKIFAQPITWYEIYVGVNEDNIINNTKISNQATNTEKNIEEQETKATPVKEEMGDSTGNNIGNTDSITQEKPSHPILNILFPLLLGIGLFTIGYKFYKSKFKKETKEPEIIIEPYKDDFDTTGYIDVEYREIDKDK